MNHGIQNRCFVIGLDGASPRLIRRFVSQGHLPNLARLIRTGQFGTLESTFPPMSPSAWTSFMTGKNPGKHGVFDFTQRQTGTYRARITSRSDQTTLWSYLSSLGRKVAVFNVPQTYPVEVVDNGIIVTGLGTPQGRRFTHPQSLGDELLTQGYRIDANVHFRAGVEHEFLSTSFETARSNVEIILPYLRSETWDLVVAVLRLTDEVPHYFWKYMDRDHPAYEDRPEFADAIRQCYSLADELVGRLIETAGDSTIIVMSDHGFGPLYRDVYLNEWLKREGFLTLRSRMSGSALLSSAMRRIGFTRSRVGPILSRIGLSRLRGALREGLGARASLIPNDSRTRLSDLVDWSSTRAYSMGYIGQVFVNLAGREPEGIVAPGAEYEQVIEALTESLLDMPDPDDGKPIVDRVLRGSEVYHGAYVDDAPDLFIVMRGFSYITRESYEWSLSGDYVVEPPTLECAAHRPDGVLIMSGHSISKQPVDYGARIIDLAPTIIHMLDEAVPLDMDGEVLSGWLAPELRRNSVKYAESDNQPDTRIPHDLSNEEEADVLQRLRDLGYVD